MQHLSVRTAVQINPADPDWEKTAHGRPFSYKYGFGVLDAYAFVAAARTWKSVAPQTRLAAPHVQLANGTMNVLDEMAGGARLTREGVVSRTAVTRAMVAAANLAQLEHVTAKVWIQHARRGDVEVELVSPAGVRSVLAAKRSRDAAATGFPGWRFMTVKHWEEDPVGEWTLRVKDQGNEHGGALLGWALTLWGAAEDPTKAVQYDVAKLDSVFPPLPAAEADTHPLASSSLALAATSTKAYAHPTSALPTDHGEAAGEAAHAAFPSASGAPSTSASASGAPPSMTPTADEGWFPAMDSLAGHRRWLAGALALTLLFLAGAGGFFLWRRRRGGATAVYCARARSTQPSRACRCARAGRRSCTTRSGTCPMRTRMATARTSASRSARMRSGTTRASSMTRTRARTRAIGTSPRTTQRGAGAGRTTRRGLDEGVCVILETSSLHYDSSAPSLESRGRGMYLSGTIPSSSLVLSA
jgi:subtilisin-like proprotein convertase family protein